MKNEKQIRADILSAAEVLFSKYGFVKTSVDDIAKMCHHAKGSVYYNFENKLDIYKELVSNEFDKIRSSLETMIERRNANKDTISDYLLVRMHLFYKAKLIKQLLCEKDENSDFALAASSIRSGFDKWEWNYFNGMCRKGIEDGVLRADIQPRSFADMLQMVLKSIEVQLFKNDSFDSSINTYEYMVKMLLGNINNNKDIVK